MMGMISETSTDSNGRFTLAALEGRVYRVQAVLGNGQQVPSDSGMQDVPADPAATIRLVIVPAAR